VSSTDFYFENPLFLLALIPAFLLILLPFFRLPKNRRKSAKKIVPVILHLIIAILLVMILSGFSLLESSQQQAVMILADMSHSTAPAEEDILSTVDRLLEEIDVNASVGVMFRGNAGEADSVREKIRELETMGATVYPIDNPIINISSTQLRRMLVFRCAQPFLSEHVLDYIRRNRLYGTEDDYRNLPIERLESMVTSLLKPNRVNHVLGCREAAVDLAKRWGADETDAARAGLLHDITKALDPFLQLTLCREYGITLDAFSQKNPKTLHALTGSLVARHIFGENDAVVNAVRHHTTGKANMSLLEKIIYVADYMEPNRVFAGVEELRQLAYSDLDAALKRGLEMTVELLRQQGRTVSPESLEALEYLK